MRSGSDARLRWLRRWHWALNTTLVLVGIVLGIVWSPRAFLLLPAVLIAFAPFSWARVQIDRYLATHFAAPRTLTALACTAVVADAVMVAQILTGIAPERAPFLHTAPLAWVGPVWFSTFAILATSIAVGRFSAGFGRRLGRSVGAWRVRPKAAPEMPADNAIGRRQFLRQAGVLGAGAPFVASVSGANLSYDFRVEEYEIELPHWPAGLDGLRIAHLSDIHVGGAMDRRRLGTVAALTNRARPDMVLHTGDFLTHRDGDFDLPLYEALAKIEAPHGQWGCLGNHDFDDVHRLVRKLREAGVQTLRNRLVTLSIDGHEVELAGMDYAFGRAQWGAIYAQIHAAWGPRRPVPRILLNHDPTAFAALPDGCADLVCSGHTHGGQIGVQWGPQRATTIVGLVGIPDQGLFARGDMRLFVTRCVGFYGYPMRIGIPPEVAILTMRRARPKPTAA